MSDVRDTIEDYAIPGGDAAAVAVDANDNVDANPAAVADVAPPADAAVSVGDPNIC